MDEKQAIQRLKNGDISGLEFLVACHQVKAVRTAYLITRDLGLAEDIVQDSFLQAFRSIRGFDATRPFEPWFLRSVVNASVKTMQRSARQVQVGDESDEARLAELAQGLSRSKCRWSPSKSRNRSGMPCKNYRRDKERWLFKDISLR